MKDRRCPWNFKEEPVFVAILFALALLVVFNALIYLIVTFFPRQDSDMEKQQAEVHFDAIHICRTFKADEILGYGYDSHAVYAVCRVGHEIIIVTHGQGEKEIRRIMVMPNAHSAY